MAFPNYVSCMKIGGYPLLPPLMTENRREECCKYRQEATDVEQRLNNSRHQIESHDASPSEQSPCIDYEPCLPASSSVDNREILLDFVKTVLQDVLHTEEGQNLQDQIMEELGKLDLNSDDRSQDDTFNNVPDNFSFNEIPDRNNSTAQNDPLFNYDEMEDSLLVEQKHLTEISPDSVHSESHFDPPKFVRRNSYTLDSPSQCVITYLKSLTKQEGVESWEPDQPKGRSVSKNLNEVWGTESPVSQLEDCTNRLGVMEISDFSPHQQTSPESASLKNNNYSPHNSPRTPLGNVNHVINQDNKLLQLQHRSATKIQAVARGYLVRRLMKTNKVIELKTTIKDCLIYALSLHAEQTISPADINLHVGLIRQVTAACYELHSIFFEWSTTDKMNLIRQDRMKLQTLKIPKVLPMKSPRKFLKRRLSSTSMHSSISNASNKNSIRSSPYSLSKSSSASALKYQPWV